MKINLIAIGTRMPEWVTQGMHEYIKRMPVNYQVNLVEIPAIKRERNTNIKSVLQQEGIKLLSKCQPNSITITLDRLGKEITTKQLAQQLQQWHDINQDINLLIGGPEGIDPALIQQSQYKWSLSKLTLPHPMVRVLIAEQLYRAYSIIIGHPYHR